MEDVREQLPISESAESAAALGQACVTLGQLESSEAIAGKQIFEHIVVAGQKVEMARGLLESVSGLLAEFLEDIGIDPATCSSSARAALIDYRLSILESKGVVQKWQTGGERDGKPAERNWGYNKSEVDDYEETFAEVLKGRTILSLLEGFESLCVVDLMASTTVVRTLLKHFPLLKKRGFAFRLSDIRTDEEIDEDNSLNIEQLEGDLGQLSTLRKVKAKVGKGKASLVLGRPVAGIYSLPFHWIFFRRAISTIWDMLDQNNGIALLQVPPPHMAKLGGFSVSDWVTSVRNLGIDIEYKRNTIMLTKRPDSPPLITR